MQGSNNDDFDQILFNTEHEFNQYPDQFWRNIYRYAGLGYAVIFFQRLLFHFSAAVFGIAIGLISNDAMSRFVEFSGYGLVYALFLASLTTNPFKKHNQAKGYELTAQSCPVLFEELDQLREKQPAPHLHKIILNHEHSCSLQIVPYFTFLGVHQYTLSLSMEQLLIISPDEMRTVLAHEWGHLAGKHDVLAVRMTNIISYMKFYIYVLEKFRFVKLLDYMERLLINLVAYKIVLARQDEYLADAVSAKLTNTKETAKCLTTCCVIGNWLAEQYWLPLYDLARILPKPELTPFTTLRSFVSEYRFSQNELAALIQHTLAIKANPYLIHPTLRQRLSALDAEPTCSGNFSQSAAETWFGSQLDDLLAIVDKQWQQHYTAAWGKWHESKQTVHSAEVILDPSSAGTLFCDES
ncbi:MAG: M48 family metallopeptidase [Methyloglobulus sp.]|nr:M48 family metalloprotease [Methyloglobulus sp.]